MEPFAHYEILMPLGRGGMGEVFKARVTGPHGFEKIVALKRIRPVHGSSQNVAERFILEARIAAHLRCANIVQVFDFGCRDDELYLVMEYVDGPSLERIMRALWAKGGSFTISQSIQIASSIARALEHAHRASDLHETALGVVHRDVNPANILVSRSGEVKLTDFGVAAVLDMTASSQTIVGKPRYMAPEQALGLGVDARADLFALGLVLYQMLAKRLPWPSGAIGIEADSTLEEVGYRPPSAFEPAVPPDLDAIVRWMLEPARERRIPNAEMLLTSLLDFTREHAVPVDPLELRALVEAAGEPEAAEDPFGTTADERSPRRTETPVVQPTSAFALERRTEAPAMRSPTSSSRRGGAVRAIVVAAITGAIASLIVGISSLPSQDGLGPPSGPEKKGQADQRAASPKEATPDEPIAREAQRPIPVAPAVALEPKREAPVATPTELPRPSGTKPASRPRPRARGTSDAPTIRLTGRVDLYAEPWGEIWIDGTKIARTAPAPALELEAGRHQIVVINPVLHLRAERAVVVSPNESVYVSMKLER
jgi:eukaryotic-like serine/threonine-protein kinase